MEGSWLASEACMGAIILISRNGLCERSNRWNG